MGYFKAPGITTSARILSTWGQKELLYDTDLNQLFICDGITMGCNPLDANVASSISNLTSAHNSLSNTVSSLNSVHNILSNAVSNETSNRISADNVLSVAISNLVSADTALSLRVVSVNSYLDNISALSVGGTSVKGLQSVINALSNRISAVVIAGASVTSAELSHGLSVVSAQAASAINVVSNAVSNEISNRISADNVLSLRVNSVNTYLNNLSGLSGATSVKGLQSVLNALSNRISAIGGASVTSTELSHGLSVVSAQAASAINVVSVALADEISIRTSAEAALSVRIDTQSQSISILSQGHSILSQRVSVLSGIVSETISALNTLSNNLLVETSNRLSADDALSLRVNTVSNKVSALCVVSAKSAGGTSVQGLQLIINALSNRISAIPAASVTSVELQAVSAQAASAVNVVSIAAANALSVANAASQAASIVSLALVNETSNRISADNVLSGAINTVSIAAADALSVGNAVSALLNNVSVKSVGGTSVKGIQSALNALSNRISAAGSVTSAELQTVSAQAASALSVTNAAVSVLSLAIISVEAHVNTVSTAAANAANAASIVSVALALETSNRTSADLALSLRIDTQSQSISVLSNKISAICAISAKSVGGSSVQGLQSVINALSNRISVIVGGTASVTSAEHVSVDSRVTSVLNYVNTVSAKSVGGTSVQGLQSVINALSNVLSSSYANLDARQLSLVDRVSVNSGLISNINSVLNNVSVKSVGGTSVKGLQSVLNALSNRISAASGGVGSVTSAELQVVSAQAASALSVVEAALSSRVTSVNTLLNGISALSVGGTSVKGLQSVINALSNRISAAGAGSVTSVELNAVSAQAASAISVVSVQAASALSVVEAALSSRVTSVNTFLNGLSVKSGATSVKGLQSVLNTLSNRISAAAAGIASVTSAELNAVSAQAASAINVVSNELVVLSTLVSNINSAITNVSVKSVGGTSVKGLQSSFNALSLRINAVAGGSVTSAEHISVDTRVTSVYNFIQGVSALSVGGTSVKGLQSVINALSNRISAAGAGSVTSAELQAVSAQAASAISVVNNAVSIVSVANAAVSARVNSVNTILDNLSVKSVGGTSVRGLQSVLNALSNRISAGGGTASVTSTELSVELALKANISNTWKTISTAAHTFSVGDNDQILMFTTNVTSIIATIPTGLSTGWHCLVYRATGSGNLYISSLGTKEGNGFVLSIPNTAAALYHRGGNVHVVLGAEPVSTGLSNDVSVLSNTVSDLLSVVSALSNRVSILSVQVAAAGAPQIKILGGQQVISTVTLTNISGFAVTVSAGVVYELFAKIMVNKPASGPSRWGLTFPAMTWSRGNIEATGSAIQAGITVSTRNFQARWNEDSTGSIVLSTLSTAAVSLYVEFEGVFKANAAGTIQLQAGGSTTTAAITILDGSFVKLYRLG